MAPVVSRVAAVTETYCRKPGRRIPHRRPLRIHHRVARRVRSIGFAEYYAALDEYDPVGIRKSLPGRRGNTFAELEETLLPGDPRLGVIQARRALSKITGKQELKLFSIFGYTDDVTLTCVGHDRMLRAVRCWRRLLRDFNVKTAIPRKRGLGSSQEFLGLHFHATAGLVVVPQDKRLRALACLNDILSKARVTFRSYRALMGLLEWLRPVLGMGANAMYGLYGRVFKKGMRAGPSSVMEVTERMLEKCAGWKVAMLAGAGNSYAAVSSRSVAAPRPTTQIFHLYSDAAIEDNGEGGLGGACHGFVWYYRLRPRDRRLHITALEFLGVALKATMS